MAELKFGMMWVTNFKSFVGNHKFSFNQNPGLYFVAGVNKDDPQIGGNGAGKSTMFTDALMWVLFDKTIRDKRPADSVSSWSVGGATNIGLELSRGDVWYTIRRSRRPNGLWVKEADGPEHAIDQAGLERILGLTEDTFRRTIVLGQFGQMFLEMAPEAQSQMFTDVLNLNVWLRAADLANQNARKAQREADRLNVLVEEADKYVRKLEGELERAVDSSKNWEDDAAVRQKKAKAVLQDAKLDFEDLKAKQPPKPKSSFKELQAKVDAARKIVRDIQNEASDKAAALRVFDRDIDELYGKIEVYKKSSADSTCPECKQVVSAKHIRDKVKELADLAAKATKRLGEESVVHTQLLHKKDDAEAAQKHVEAARDRAQAAESGLELYRSKLETAQVRVDNAAQNLRDIDKQVNPYEAIIDSCKESLKSADDAYKKAKDDSADAHEEFERYSFWTGSFRDIRLKRLEDALRELEMTTTGYAEALGLEGWAIQFATERETKSGSTSIGFNTLLYPPDQKEPVRWSSYCGGEVQRWQLAVSFALSEILLARAGLTPNIEIYDEPTRGLSPQGVARLIEELHGRALEQKKAIYIVDHHALDTGLFDGTLTVTKKDGASSFKWN